MFTTEKITDFSVVVGDLSGYCWIVCDLRKRAFGGPACE